MANKPGVSGFIAALEPLLQLGPNHAVPKAVVAALVAEWQERAREATGHGHDAETRAWWSGAATLAKDLQEELEKALEERRELPAG